MSFRTTFTALGGEHVLAVAPAPAFPSVDAGWRRRTRMFTGRALDDRALTREQEARAGQVVLLGQTLSPGRVVGLDVSPEVTPAADFLRVSPGIGILASGEDVVLGRELRIAVDALVPGGAPEFAGILCLAPVIRHVRGDFDPTDPCVRDEAADAFADEQRVDGVQVVLLPWEDAWAPLDLISAQRNQLAYTVFELERTLEAGDIAPWQVGGVPLALIGFEAGRVTYVDRHAVARRGGLAPMRTPLVAPPLYPGGPALWEARRLQLADHLADARIAFGGLPTVETLGFARLPPAGIIPPEAIELDPRINLFFPPAWRLRCAPIPREQLDGALQRAAGLAPLSAAIGEELLVLVPVPQAVYEPRLLELDEQPDPQFQLEIDQLVAERKELLGRRLYNRNSRDAILRAIDTSLVVADPVPDPAALEDEGPITEISGGEPSYELVLFNGLQRPKPIVDLFGRLQQPPPGTTTPLVTDAERAILLNKGLAPLINALDDKLRRADDTIDFGFVKSQTDLYRLRQYVLGNANATRLAVSPVLANIAKGDTSVAIRDDITRLTGIVGKPPGTTPATTQQTAPTTTQVVQTVPGGTQSLTLGPAGLALTAPPRGLLESLDLGQGATPDAVRESGALIGGHEMRTMSAAERMAPVVSTEIRDAAKATNYATAKAMIALHNLNFRVADLEIHGSANPQSPVRRPLKVGQLAEDAVLLESLLLDPLFPGNPDESVYFNDATQVLEGHVVAMRNLEGRVAQYRSVVIDCKQVLALLAAPQSAVALRLAELEAELTERRHAVATVRALLADELARIERVIARRRAVLAQHVTELAYVRPRYFDGLVEAPAMSIDPALLDSPVPACLGGHPDAPDELDRLLLLLREAPLAWLRYTRSAIDHLDRIELLHGLVLTARNRVQVTLQTGVPQVVQAPGRYGAPVAAVARAQVDAVWAPRAAVAQVDVRRFVGMSWIESREAARELVSLGDLIEGSHGRRAAATAALNELAQIGSVAACLWSRVGDVLPVIRLAWADALSQYETGHGLRALSALPRWREVDVRLRHDLELLAEWLIDRAEPSRADAVAWMLDLVRVTILLASHAPVDEIIAGSVPSPSPAHPGAMVPIAIDPARVRIGMAVTFFQGSVAVASGVVEDLVGDRARARVMTAVRADLRLDAGVRAQLTVRPPGSAG